MNAQARIKRKVDSCSVPLIAADTSCERTATEEATLFPLFRTLWYRPMSEGDLHCAQILSRRCTPQYFKTSFYTAGAA